MVYICFGRNSKVVIFIAVQTSCCIFTILISYVTNLIFIDLYYLGEGSSLFTFIPL